LPILSESNASNRSSADSARPSKAWLPVVTGLSTALSSPPARGSSAAQMFALFRNTV
jgi:hypothetical protein